MRTYDDIIEDYLTYIYYQTGKEIYHPDYYFAGMNDDELTLEKGKIYKYILEGCYDVEKSGYYFSKFILGDLTYAGYPEPYRYNGLSLKWFNILKQRSHICIMCGRGHGKSTFWSIIEPLRRAFLYENQHILLEGSSAEQVEEGTIAPIKKIIENNEALKSKMPKKIISSKWTNNYLTYNGGTILGRGFGSAVRGKQLDYLVVDDILRDDNALSDRQIENFLFEALEPMVTVKRGQIIVVGTPKNETDILHTLMEKSQLKNSSWHFSVYPAIINYEKKKLQCPDRFTWNQLMQKRIDQGKRRFEKEYQCSEKIDLISNGKIKKIRDVQEGDYILTHDGKESKVTHKFERKYSGNMYYFKTFHYNQELDFTPEHPLLTLRNNFLKYIEAKNITKNDYLVFPINKDIVKTKYLDIEKYLNTQYSIAYRNGKKILSAATKRNLLTPKQIEYVYLNKKTKTVKHLAQKFRIKENTMYWIRKKVEEKNYVTKKSIPSKTLLDEKLCKLFGYYLSEGSLSKEGVSFSFSTKETNYITEVEQIIKEKFNIRARRDISIKNNTTTVYFYNKILASVFLTLFGKGAQKKFIHTNIKKLPKKLLKKIIIGYLNGDGHKLSEQKYMFATVSEQLALDIREISLKSKLVCSFKKIKNKKKGIIRGRIVNISPYTYHGTIYYNENKKYGYINKTGTLLFSKIKDLRTQKVNEITVYNLEVKGKETYCSPNATIHNCLFRPESTTLFPDNILRPALTRGKSFYVEHKPDKDTIYYMGVDLARSGAASADYSAYIVIALDPDTQTRRIVHLERHKGIKIQIQVEKIAELSRKFNNCLVMVEKNNIGVDFIDLLIDNYNTPVEEYTTTATKKENLIRFLISIFEHEKIIIPYGDDESKEEMEVLLDELGSFSVVPTKAGNEKMQGIGAHDDTVMALALANHATLGSFGSPCAVSNFKGNNLDKHESDLVTRIRMGLLR